MKEHNTSLRQLQVPVGQQGINFKVTMIYGHVDLLSWLEWDGEKVIGMGSKTAYNSDGQITEHSVSPTGCSIKI